MKAVIQRVRSASVEIDNQVHPVRSPAPKGEDVPMDIGTTSNGVHARIKQGYLIFLGIDKDDNFFKAERLADKIAALRIFEDEQGKMNRSVNEVNGEALVVSQFTLCADLARGHRPSFDSAAPPETAQKIYEHFIQSLNTLITRKPVRTGLFGARMQVNIQNDGPVTFVYEL